MILEKLINDLTTNPLFIIFTIIELAIFFYGVYYLYKSHKGRSNINDLGERIKTFFEIKKENDNEQNEESIKYLNRSDDLTKTVIKLVSSSEENEMGTDIVSIERLLRYEYEKPQSLVRTAINILPVIGLIGTFLGISIAVYQLNFSSDIVQIPDAIRRNLNSLTPFLSGIKLAFYTTILALVLALILRISFQFSSTHSKNATIKFLNYFSIELSEYIKPAGPAEKIAKSITGFSRRVSKLSSDIESALNKIVENYSKNSESQARTFDKSIKDLNNIQDGIISKLKVLWDHISETLNHTTEQITLATDSFTKISEKSSENYRQLGLMAGQFQEISASQIENTTKIGLAIRKLSEDNQIIIDQITKFITPLDDLRLKYESALSKTVELNEPFKETNTQLKEYFKQLVQSINDLQIQNSVLVGTLNTYASSLESNLGAQLSNIVDAENKGQVMMQSLFEVQTKLSQSVENLNSYSQNLGEASHLLVNDIDNQLKALFVDLSSRQNIAIINNTSNDTTQKTESILEKQNKISLNIFKSLRSLNDTLEEMSLSIIKPPFFSKARWFGNGNYNIKMRRNEILDTQVIKKLDDTKD